MSHAPRLAGGVLLVGVLSVAPIEASAQAADPLTLTLADAMSLAEGGNPELRRAQNSADLNPAESRATWLDQLLPSAQLTLFQTAFTGNLTRRALDDFGNPRPNPSADWNYFSSTRHELGLFWSFQGPSLFEAHKALRYGNQERELAAASALTGLQVQVQRLYMDALEQGELTALEAELIEARQTDQEIADRLFRLAGRTRVDVLNAELEVERQRLALQQQEAMAERALLDLRTAMGLDEGRAIEIVETPIPLFDPSALGLDDLLVRGLLQNPSVMQSDVAVRAAEVARAQTGANWWPRVDLGMRVFRQAYEPQTSALFDPSISSDLESSFYVQFSLPILNGFFGQRLEQQRAAVELANRRETDRETRLQLEATIRGALLELENQWASFQISERAATIAGEALRLAREEYRLGTRTFEDLRSAFQQEADTRRGVITARHSFVDALLSLEEAVGAPVRPGSGVPAGGR